MRPRTWGLILVTLMLAACGPRPKPAELVSYEQMRQGEHAEQVKQRFPKLFQESDRQHKRAQEAHEDSDDADAMHFTKLATATWRAAVARSQRMDHEASLRAAQNRLKIAEEGYVDAERRLKAADDAVARQKRVIEMQKRLAEAEAAAMANKRVAAVKQKVDAAALSLKDAENMNAATHAPGEFNKAAAGLKMALDSFTAKRYPEAGAAADAALVDAKAAIVAAKPKWEVEQAKLAVEAKFRKMLEVVATIPGAEGRIERRGLVVMMRGLFAAGKSDVSPEKYFAVDQVAKLSTDNAEFRLVVEGHTDNRGRASRNLALSEKRAQAVTNYLGGKGVAAGRMTAIGRGDETPIADNSKKDGRAQNRRVEVVYIRP